MTARLYIVAGPIGNFEDITLRALKVLRTVEIIAAEDTRQTGRLLAHHNIPTTGRMLSCHEHNEQQRTRQLLNHLQQGKSVALVTDAGTPGISDPGFRLIKGALAKKLAVIPVPGVSAAITALSVSGLPTDTFVFAGFPPRKKTGRKERLRALAAEPATLIFYESPRRIIDFLTELRAVMGDRQGVLCREMTKAYEEFLRGSLSEIAAVLQNKETVKGEITLIVAGADPARAVLNRDDIRQALEIGQNSPSELARQLSARSGLPRRQIYQEILKLQKE